MYLVVGPESSESSDRSKREPALTGDVPIPILLVWEGRIPVWLRLLGLLFMELLRLLHLTLFSVCFFRGGRGVGRMFSEKHKNEKKERQRKGITKNKDKEERFTT